MLRVDFKAQRLNPILWLIVPLALVLAPHALALPWWITLSWLLFALVSINTATRKSDWPAWLKMFLSLAGVAGVLLQYGTIIGPQGGVALLVFLTGAKLLETRTPRDRLGLLFVGCFLLVAYFLNSQSLVMAGYMIIAAAALVAAMIANTQTSPELRATLFMAGRLLLQALPLALLLFVLFPRLQGPLWGLPQQGAAQTGLSDRMSPGDFGQLTLSDEIAFRVDFSGPPPPPSALYWRGPVLWDFDGRSWLTSRSPGRPKNDLAPTGGGSGVIEPGAQPLLLAVPPTPLRGEALSTPLSYTVTLEPHHQRWLFLLGLPTRLPPLQASLGPDLQWQSKTPITQRLRYRIDASLDYQLDPDGLTPATHARTLALPEGNPQARTLARQWAARYKDPQEIANQALRLFRTEAFFYTLKPPLLGENSIDDFLFVSKRGFCEHYASAFVVLMRAAGVPARVVTGYQGGELNPLGDYWIVRQRDAHAWAEIWLPRQGWRQVDPTAAVAPNRIERGLDAGLPEGERRSGMITLDAGWLMPLRQGWDLLNNQWNQWVLGYNQDRQRQFLARLNPFLATWQGMAWGLAAAGALLLGMLALLAIPRLRKPRLDPASRLYARFCQRLQRSGLERGDAEGPADFANRAALQRPELADAIREITRLYLQLRYAHQDAGSGSADLMELKQRVKQFKP